jgi:hypothetical protein
VKRLLLLLALSLLVFGTSACDDVVVQPVISDTMQKIFIGPMVNKTGQPDVDQILNTKITQAFIVNGRLKVTEKNQADVWLDETLERYDRIVLTRDANEVPIRYKLQIIVDCTLSDAKTAKTLMTTYESSTATAQSGSSVDANGNAIEDFDEADNRSLREFTTYYVINNVGMPAEDEPTAQGRVTDQMADRVVRLVVEGY